MQTAKIDHAAVDYHIAVIGLGYVGFPLAIELAQYFPVLGFDINPHRIEELQRGSDRTHEINPDRILNLLRQNALQLSADPDDLRHRKPGTQRVFIVTVPTPIDESTQLPDLGPLTSATEMLGSLIQPQDIIVFESTVYPGVTEEICGKILEKISGLMAGKDFFLGYSPERINPGDKQHTLSKITKVVSGQTKAVTESLAQMYGRINQNNIHIAPNIKTAEAAKVIENAQRDINIAFINEITQILNKQNISIHEVLDAANTKWNFLDFKPGLVGGHCIGVDPYYLAHFAKTQAHHPEIILAGRNTNEGMSHYIAQSITNLLDLHFPTSKNLQILVLGLTFKENVPDLRNSKVIDLIKSLQKHSTKNISVEIYDPLAHPKEAVHYCNSPLYSQWEDITTPTRTFHAVIAAVPHDSIVELGSKESKALKNILEKNGIIADLKGLWRHLKHNQEPNHYHYWTL